MPSPHPPTLKPQIAIVVTRGASNNLFQVATLVRAATTIETSVRVFFRDAAGLKLRRDRVNSNEWAPSYKAVEGGLQQRLRAAEFDTMETFLRDAKEHGEDVQYWVDEATVQRAGLALEDLIACVDGTKTEAAFMQAVVGAVVLRF